VCHFAGPARYRDRELTHACGLALLPDGDLPVPERRGTLWMIRGGLPFMVQPWRHHSWERLKNPEVNVFANVNAPPVYRIWLE
jgi:hypothetical protein